MSKSIKIILLSLGRIAFSFSKSYKNRATICLFFLLLVSLSTVTVASGDNKQVFKVYNNTTVLQGGVKQHSQEYEEVQKLHLVQIQTYEQIDQLLQKRALSKVQNSTYYYIDRELGEHSKSHRRHLMVLLPHTKQVLISISREFYAKYKIPLEITSMLRPVEYSNILAAYNGNVSPTSTHPYGCTFDISHKKLSPKQKAYLRYILVRKELKGEIFATEERHQACFHIMDRLSNMATKLSVAQNDLPPKDNVKNYSKKHKHKYSKHHKKIHKKNVHHKSITKSKDNKKSIKQIKTKKTDHHKIKHKKGKKKVTSV